MQTPPTHIAKLDPLPHRGREKRPEIQQHSSTPAGALELSSPVQVAATPSKGLAISPMGNAAALETLRPTASTPAQKTVTHRRSIGQLWTLPFTPPAPPSPRLTPTHESILPEPEDDTPPQWAESAEEGQLLRRPQPTTSPAPDPRLERFTNKGLNLETAVRAMPWIAHWEVVREQTLESEARGTTVNWEDFHRAFQGQCLGIASESEMDWFKSEFPHLWGQKNFLTQE